MGQDVAPQFEKEFGGLYRDSEIQRYVREVGEQLIPFTDRPDLPWEFAVLDSDQINAFALPGGKTYITRALLFSLENEAQLASILAHEAAHVAHRHSVQQLERAQVIQGGAILAGVLTESEVVGDVSQVVGGLISMRYSREQEREADRTGLDYLVRAGYDPNAAVQALSIIREQAGSGAPPEFLSTHPDPEGREEDLQRRIDSRYGDVLTAGRTNEDRFREIVLRRARR